MHSKPIAEHSSDQNVPHFEEATEEEIESVSLSEWNEDFLTKRELKRYGVYRR